MEVAGLHHDKHQENEGAFLGPEDMDQMQQALDLVTTGVIAETKRKARFGKLVKLRAFNIFALKIRPSIKDKFEGASGLDIKRIVGSRWANAPDQVKAEYFEQAQREHNEMVAKGLIDPNAPLSKPKKSKSDIEAETAPGEQPVKRKRGRPRKSETLPVQGGEIVGDGLIPQKSDVQIKRQRKKKNEVASPAIVDLGLIGQQVSGVLDGSFDAGYLLTVRVGNSGTVLRGVVFGPGLAVPVSKTLDVAPTVMQVKRDDKITLPLAAPGMSGASTAVLSAPMAMGSVATPAKTLLASLPPSVVPVPVGLKALTNPFMQPQMSQAGYTPVSYSSPHVSYSAETIHRHVDVQSGA